MAKKITVQSVVFRILYYMRIGFATYFAFVLSAITAITTSYFLVVLNVPFLYQLFPNFTSFALVSVGTGAPVIAYVGYAHFRKWKAYESQMDIDVENNPWNKKAVAGKETEVYIPAGLVMIRSQRKLLENFGLLSEEERAVFDEIERKYEKLAKGEPIGSNK